MGRFDGAHIGYRVWRISGGRLCALNGSPWENGVVTTAQCQSPPGDDPGHDVPHPDCRCGLHALHDPWDPDLSSFAPDGVLGAVVAWGRMQIHFNGFRAQHALPIALYGGDPLYHATYEDALAWCGAWEVPLYHTVEELETEARRYADPVPREKLPQL
jgi:hypothetical protein